ncbi:MAG: aminopeptidase P family protein [Lachnospiraceae bacterium]|jgi:Xaa-Pro aminopeptidase|nr:aminopeptidase P family protein [Lachnospiraceae bacterium]MEE3460301.1 aminopeptidase P family protein [Lachnospiraceae bacterium]
MLVSEKLAMLRKYMKKQGIDAYYVTTCDYHCSEYTGGYFKTREYLSGFTGSRGDLIVTDTDAYLWTDGRYFIQAAEELEGSGIVLMKEREENVPTTYEFIEQKACKGYTVGLDAKCVPADFCFVLKKLLKKKKAILKTNADLASRVWFADYVNRPEMVTNPVYSLSTEYTGESRSEKLKRVRKKMKEYGADLHIIASLDDIAWITNLRGTDIPCNPVFLSFLAIRDDSCVLFADPECFDSRTIEYLQADGVSVLPYEKIYDLLKMDRYSRVLLDMKRVNGAIVEAVPDKKKIINYPNPSVLMKAVKNETEQANEKQAHISDGIAITKLIYWLKVRCTTADGVLKDENGNEVTEIRVAEKLEELRSGIEDYKGPSFDTIAGFGPHGAIVHYEADPKTNAVIKADDFLLLDMGGQYLRGTTDITRTVFTGNHRGSDGALLPGNSAEADKERKTWYTTVLKGHLALQNAVFKKGTSGAALDMLARRPIWEMGADFNHGTGHGVGYFLNVHEEPNRISYHVSRNPGDNPDFVPGMITSDEPGIYLEGKFGIRIENLTLCEERHKNEFGEFYGLTPLTLVPYERDAIEPSLLNDLEKEEFRKYNVLVYDVIGPHLEPEEKDWLYKVTEPL